METLNKELKLIDCIKHTEIVFSIIDCIKDVIKTVWVNNNVEDEDEENQGIDKEASKLIDEFENYSSLAIDLKNNLWFSKQCKHISNDWKYHWSKCEKIIAGYKIEFDKLFQY